MKLVARIINKIVLVFSLSRESMEKWISLD